MGKNAPKSSQTKASKEVTQDGGMIRQATKANKDGGPQQSSHLQGMAVKQKECWAPGLSTDSTFPFSPDVRIGCCQPSYHHVFVTVLRILLDENLTDDLIHSG